jgi:hypothetical protein
MVWIVESVPVHPGTKKARPYRHPLGTSTLSRLVVVCVAFVYPKRPDRTGTPWVPVRSRVLLLFFFVFLFVKVLSRKSHT